MPDEIGNPEEFGREFNRLLYASNESANSAAKKLGLNISSVRSWMSGLTFPTDEILDKIAEYYPLADATELRSLRDRSRSARRNEVRARRASR
jgi:transcriptional regulator with XRE-family HTH domain